MLIFLMNNSMPVAYLIIALVHLSINVLISYAYGCRCQLNDDVTPMPVVRWFKNEIEINQTKDVTLTFDETSYISTLQILNCIPENEGTYSCLAENEAGIAETSASLAMKSTCARKHRLNFDRVW